MEALAAYTSQKTLAEEMNELLKEIRCTKAEAAMMMNYSRSAVSQYLNGKYNSDPTEIEKKIREFIDKVRAERGMNDAGEPVRIRTFKKPEYFEGRDYLKVIGLCQECQEKAAGGILVGKSGYGKTYALKKFSELPRVVRIEGTETMNCKDIIRRLERKIGLQRSSGSIDERMERIVDFFNINEGYLIIIDEADKLINKYTQKKIEMFRNITDAASVGLVLAGELELETLVRKFDPRFANRLSYYYRMRGLVAEEVKEYLEGFEIDEKALAEFVVRATNSHTGCFRLLDRTLTNVIRLLKDKGQTQVTLKTVSEASSMMML